MQFPKRPNPIWVQVAPQATQDPWTDQSLQHCLCGLACCVMWSRRLKEASGSWRVKSRATDLTDLVREGARGSSYFSHLIGLDQGGGTQS